MSTACQDEIDKLVKKTEQDVCAALNKISSLNPMLDEKFKKYFLQAVNNRLSETFNRFEIDALFTLEKESKDSQKRPNKSERRTSKYRESPETESSTSSDHEELEKQTQLINNICIMGIPHTEKEDLQKIFFKICDRMRVNVSSRDINKISRIKNDVIVELTTLELKEYILSKKSKYIIKVVDICKTKNVSNSERVEIYNHLTPFYLAMDDIAEEAIHKGIIREFEITKKGIAVIRRRSSKPRYFTSKTELNEYLDKLL